MALLSRLLTRYLPAIAIALLLMMALQALLISADGVRYDEDGDVIMEDAFETDYQSGLDLNADAGQEDLGLKL